MTERVKTCASCIHDNERDWMGCPHMGCLANNMRDYEEKKE